MSKYHYALVALVVVQSLMHATQDFEMLWWVWLVISGWLVLVVSVGLERTG